MDKFVQNTTGGSCTQSTTKNRTNYGPPGIVMATTTATRSPPGYYPKPNIGDLMNAAGVTWGWFQGGFTPSTVCGAPPVPHRTRTSPARRSPTTCPTTSRSQYYACTANIKHVSPSRSSQVGSPTSGHAGDAGATTSTTCRVRRRARRRQPAAGLVPEGGRVRGRPPRLLRPARRAALHRAHGQRDPAVAGLGLDGDRHRLRRLRRLVRPRHGADHARLARPDRHAHRRRASAAPGAAPAQYDDRAASARACRCWSSRRGSSPTTSTTRSPSRRRSSASSRTTGASGASAAARSTRSPGR